VGRIGAGLRTLLALGAVTVLAGFAPAGPARPQAATGLIALAQLEPGQWQLRDLDAPRAAPRSLCVADPNALIQIEHPGAPCTRLVLANGAREGTIHYTCPSNGFGRTSVRVETTRLAKIDTQGIIGNAPFQLRAEARRTGSCAQSR
jgi:hypothetical protein